MKPIKEILIYSSEFPPGPGGIGNHAYNLANHLSKFHYKITVLAPIRSEFENNDKKISNEAKFELINMGKRKFRIFNLIQTFFFLIKMKFSRSSIIIATGTLPLITIGLLPNFKKNNKIGIIHGHETLMGSFFKKLLVSKSLLHYKKIIAVSDFSKKRVLNDFPSLQIDVINNGANFSKFRKIKTSNTIDTKNINLVTVGNLSKRKGQLNVVRALTEIKKKYPQVMYHMVGIPTIKNEIINEAKKLKINNNIKIHGVLNDYDMNDLLIDCDIFMMLSENLDNGDVEGFGIAIIEGNYVGLPAIGSKDCGIEDAISDEISGLLVDNKDKISISKSIFKILNDYKNFSNSSKKWADKFSWDKVINKYLGILDKI